MPNSTAILLLLLLVVAVALNLVATACLMRSDAYSAFQKTLQLALVWMVPLIGAILVLSVWAHDRKAAARDPARDDERYWMPGMGPENDSGHHGDSAGGGSSHESHAGGGGS